MWGSRICDIGRGRESIEARLESPEGPFSSVREGPEACMEGGRGPVPVAVFSPVVAVDTPAVMLLGARTCDTWILELVVLEGIAGAPALELCGSLVEPARFSPDSWLFDTIDAVPMSAAKDSALAASVSSSSPMCSLNVVLPEEPLGLCLLDWLVSRGGIAAAGPGRLICGLIFTSSIARLASLSSRNPLLPVPSVLGPRKPFSTSSKAASAPARSSEDTLRENCGNRLLLLAL